MTRNHVTLLVTKVKRTVLLPAANESLFTYIYIRGNKTLLVISSQWTKSSLWHWDVCVDGTILCEAYELSLICHTRVNCAPWPSIAAGGSSWWNGDTAATSCPHVFVSWKRNYSTKLVAFFQLLYRFIVANHHGDVFLLFSLARWKMTSARFAWTFFYHFSEIKIINIRASLPKVIVYVYNIIDVPCASVIIDTSILHRMCEVNKRIEVSATLQGSDFS